MHHLISLLILCSAIGSYAIGLAKPAETLVFVAMGLELWFWVRVGRARHKAKSTHILTSSPSH